ncbi:MAG: hypothetical protein M1300_04550 [Epsilonproteobacteria bacterium]|nr:hypothetical protein [Campylobacterota bacterium]
MFYMFIVGFVGVISIFAFGAGGNIIAAIIAAFVTVFLLYRHAMKKNKAYLAAVEEVSKEAMPELYALVKDKTKHIK